MKLTFVDAGVLIVAARGTDVLSDKALEVLEDSDRVFAASPFIKLEVLPKAIYYQQSDEAQFYEAFFDNVSVWMTELERLVQLAYQIASQFGLAGMDALHVAAALALEVDEFITTEKSTKPMHRVPNIRVISIAE